MAIQLAMSGEREGARSILVQLVRSDPHNEKAWIWLIEVLPEEQKRRAAELFNQANPDSILAHKALEAVFPQAPKSESADAPQPLSQPEEPANPPESLPHPEEPAQQPVESQSENYFPWAAPILSETVSPPESAPQIKDTIAQPEIQQFVTTDAPVVQEEALPDHPVSVEVRPPSPKPLPRAASLSRKSVLIVVGIALLAVIMVGILVVLMSAAGLFKNVQNPLFAPALPTIVLVTPSATLTEIPDTPTFTVTPIKAVTATPQPPTAVPSPTAYLATPANAKAIDPENAAQLTFFYQSALPENALVSSSLRYMIILDGSSQVRPLDINTLRRIFIANLPSDSMVTAAFSPDESSVAVGIDHGGVLVYAMPSGKVLNSLSASSITIDSNSSLAFSSDEHYLIASAGKGYIVWDLRTSASIGQGSLPDGPFINGQPAYGPVVLAGQTFYAPCGSAICATDVTTQKEILHYPASDRDLVSQFALSPSGDQVAAQTSGKDNLFSITVYNSADGTVLGTIDTALTTLWDLAYTPDGRLLVAWGQQSTNGQDGLVLMDAEKFTQVFSLDIGKVGQPDITAQYTQRLLFSLDGGIIGVQSPHALRIYAVKMGLSIPKG